MELLIWALLWPLVFSIGEYLEHKQFGTSSPVLQYKKWHFLEPAIGITIYILGIIKFWS